MNSKEESINETMTNVEKKAVGMTQAEADPAYAFKGTLYFNYQI